MQIYTTYKVKIKHYNHIFKETVSVYRRAVDSLIEVCLSEWDAVSKFCSKQRINYVEHLIHATKDNPNPEYDFDQKFYKMPSYIGRGAISEAIGKVFSYKSSLKNWEENPSGKALSAPKAGFVFPSMYRDNMCSPPA